MAHDEQLDTPQARRLVAAPRRGSRDLPDVAERIDGFGHTTFSVKGKSLVIAGMGVDGTSVLIKSDRTEMER